MVGQKSQQQQRSTVRIIGGDWRGRKLPVLNAQGLRPTADRIRETLFNWLANELPGARCLDLFAGSASLSFEALSRGAAHVTAVDHHAMAVQLMINAAEALGTDNLCAVHSSAEQWLQGYMKRQSKAQFDIIFLDPPFQAHLLEKTAIALEQSKCLAPNALIYIEQAAGPSLATLPGHWCNYRQKTTGNVSYQLFSVSDG